MAERDSGQTYNVWIKWSNSDNWYLQSASRRAMWILTEDKTAYVLLSIGDGRDEIVNTAVPADFFRAWIVDQIRVGKARDPAEYTWSGKQRYTLEVPIHNKVPRYS